MHFHSNKSKQLLKDADEIIKNAYSTLLTRETKGCYVYCADEDLSNYINTKFFL